MEENSWGDHEDQVRVEGLTSGDLCDLRLTLLSSYLHRFSSTSLGYPQVVSWPAFPKLPGVPPWNSHLQHFHKIPIKHLTIQTSSPSCHSPPLSSTHLVFSVSPITLGSPWSSLPTCEGKKTSLTITPLDYNQIFSEPNSPYFLSCSSFLSSWDSFL